MTPPTNMIVVGPRVRRPRPRAGDLLVCNLRGERWIAGRVVHMNCRMCADTDGQEPLYDFYRLEVRKRFNAAYKAVGVEPRKGMTKAQAATVIRKVYWDAPRLRNAALKYINGK